MVYWHEEDYYLIEDKRRRGEGRHLLEPQKVHLTNGFVIVM